MIQLGDVVLYLNHFTCLVLREMYNPNKGLMYLIQDINSERLWIAHKEDIKLV